jgi:hypothetical protein
VGTDLWRGEAEAAEVVQLTVDHADADGRLRGILDAVNSNRVEDHFSEHAVVEALFGSELHGRAFREC